MVYGVVLYARVPAPGELCGAVWLFGDREGVFFACRVVFRVYRAEPDVLCLRERSAHVDAVRVCLFRACSAHVPFLVEVPVHDEFFEAVRVLCGDRRGVFFVVLRARGAEAYRAWCVLVLLLFRVYARALFCGVAVVVCDERVERVLSCFLERVCEVLGRGVAVEAVVYAVAVAGADRHLLEAVLVVCFDGAVQHRSYCYRVWYAADSYCCWVVCWRSSSSARGRFLAATR